MCLLKTVVGLISSLINQEQDEGKKEGGMGLGLFTLCILGTTWYLQSSVISEMATGALVWVSPTGCDAWQGGVTIPVGVHGEVGHST